MRRTPRSRCAAPLPPGSYYVGVVRALPDEGDDAWQDPGFLDSLIVDATSIIVSDGEVRSVALKK